MIEKNFGIRLQALREARGLTQEEAAKQVRISYRALQRHESGFIPNMNNLGKYAIFYEVDNFYLLTGEGESDLDDVYNKDRIGSDLPSPMSQALGQAVEMLATVLNSGDQVFIQALMSNLIAFSRAVTESQRQSTRIAKLEGECKDLKNRLAALEEKLKGTSPPGGDCEERDVAEVA